MKKNKIFYETIIYIQQWDYHRRIKFLYIQDNQVIASFSICDAKDRTHLDGIYVDEKYRNKGMLKTMLNDAFDYNDRFIKSDLYLYVKKDNFVYKKYLDYGFESYEIADDNSYDELKYTYKKDTTKK